MKYYRNGLRILALLCAATMILPLFCACGENGNETPVTSGTDADVTVTDAPDETDATPDYIDENGDLCIVKDGEGKFTVVRGEFATDANVAAAVSLYNRIIDGTGVRPEIRTCFVFPNETDIDNVPEIIVGDTSRKETAALAEKIGDNRFAVKISGCKIVIAASNDMILPFAVDYFFDNCVTSIGDGKMTVKNDVEYYSDASVNYLEKILRSGAELESTASRIVSVGAPTSSIKTAQGGYFDGRYFYQIFIQKDTNSNEAKNVDRIVKYDVQNKKIEKTSGDLDLNHANDIAYNPKTNRLLIVHNNPNRTKVTLVDPDTLEAVGVQTLPESIYCMDYNEKHDRYVIGLSGGQDFRFLDKDFKVASGVYKATTVTKGYVTQGMTCDDDFIYFVLYKENVITVYDWSGKFVTLIKFDVGSIEPENISVVNGEIYVVCGQNGATMYKITPKAAK